MTSHDETRETLLDQIQQARRDDPDLERQLARYRSDREDYDRLRNARTSAPAAPAPVTRRSAVTKLVGRKSSLGRVR